MTATETARATQDRQHLMVSCQGLVRAIAWKVHQRLPAHVDLEDLVSYGQVGLAEAAGNFDPSRGGQFTTFAWYRIRGAMLDGLSRMRWFHRGDFDGGRYERMANEALDDNRPEGGAVAGAPDRGVEVDGAWLKGASRALAVACLASSAGRADLESVADNGRERPDEIAIRREMAQRLRERVAALPSDMRVLVQATYFQGRTLTEAAGDVGISKAWASRLHSRALARLAEALQE